MNKTLAPEVRRELQRIADLELGEHSVIGVPVYLGAFGAFIVTTPFISDLPLVAGFCGLFVLLSCVLRSYLTLNRKRYYAADSIFWKRALVTVVLLNAAFQGFFCMGTFLKYGVSVYSLFAMLITVGIAAGAVASYRSHLFLLRWHMALMLFPSIIVLCFFNNSLAYGLVLLQLMTYFFLSLQAKTQHRLYWDAMTNNKILEQQRRELESWSRILEERVDQRTKAIKEKNRQLDESYFLTMDALINALDAREQETGKHSLRVAFYATELAQQFGIQGRELEEIAMGALMHDLGKIGTPDQILLKPGRLTAEERLKINEHPKTGWSMIKDVDFFGRGRDLVLQHQERYDGSGYPQKLKEEEIFIGARIFAVVDVFDALMSERSYKNSLTFEQSYDYIKKSRGTLFDPLVVDVFLKIPKEKWLDLRQFAQSYNFKALIMQRRR